MFTYNSQTQNINILTGDGEDDTGTIRVHSLVTKSYSIKSSRIRFNEKPRKHHRIIQYQMIIVKNVVEISIQLICPRFMFETCCPSKHPVSNLIPFPKISISRIPNRNTIQILLKLIIMILRSLTPVYDELFQ